MIRKIPKGWVVCEDCAHYTDHVNFIRMSKGQCSVCDCCALNYTPLQRGIEPLCGELRDGVFTAKKKVIKSIGYRSE